MQSAKLISWKLWAIATVMIFSWLLKIKLYGMVDSAMFIVVNIVRNIVGAKEQQIANLQKETQVIVVLIFQ
jgi:hypothetical protein